MGVGCVGGRRQHPQRRQPPREPPRVTTADSCFPHAQAGGGGSRPAGRQGAPRGRGRLAPLPPTATVTVAPTRSAVRAARGLVRPVTKHRCPPPSARGGSWG